MEVVYKGKSKGKGAKSDKQDKECYVCGKKGHFATGPLVTSKPRQNSERGGRCQSGPRCSKIVCVHDCDNIVKYVSLSQSGCEGHEDGLVMIDSGASVNVCSKWYGESVLEKSDGSVRLRGADGRTPRFRQASSHGEESERHLKQYDFHVVEVTKQILRVSFLCENGIETHLARHPFLKYGERHEPLIKKSGVYFVKAQIVHDVKGAVEAVMRAEDSQKVMRTG